MYKAVDYPHWCQAWKQTAKKWRDDFFDVRDLLLDEQGKASQRLKLLEEGLEATKRTDGHWSDRVRWITWVEKVEIELEREIAE